MFVSESYSITSLSREMSRLTRDGTAEPVSRDQILRRERGQGNIIFPVQLTTSRIGNLTRLIHTLNMCICVTIHENRYVTHRITVLQYLVICMVSTFTGQNTWCGAVKNIRLLCSLETTVLVSNTELKFNTHKG